MKTIAIAYDKNPTKVTIWAEDKGVDKDGSRKFHVINGEWSGVLSPGMTIVWEGEVPSPENQHYESAIDWIEGQLK